MQYLQCFLAMRTPTTTPISSTTPTSSHRLRVSRDLLASAAASRPKTSAKQSWKQQRVQTKTRKRKIHFVIRHCLGFFSPTLKEYSTWNLQLGPKCFGTFTKMQGCVCWKKVVFSNSFCHPRYYDKSSHTRHCTKKCSEVKQDKQNKTNIFEAL